MWATTSLLGRAIVSESETRSDCIKSSLVVIISVTCLLAIKDCIDRRCAHCGAEQDNTGHFAQCSLLHPVRGWMEYVCTTLGWPRLQPGWFSAFLIYGYLPRSGDLRVLTALHGAVLSATLHARRARTDQEAGRSCTATELRGIAARRLRYHMLLDWRVATGQGYVEWRALDSTRPATRAACGRRRLKTSIWPKRCHMPGSGRSSEHRPMEQVSLLLVIDTPGYSTRWMPVSPSTRLTLVHKHTAMSTRTPHPGRM